MASAAIHAELATVAVHGIGSSPRNATNLDKWMAAKNYMVVTIQGLKGTARYLIVERSADGESENLLSYSFERLEDALEMKSSLEAQASDTAGQVDE